MFQSYLWRLVSVRRFAQAHVFVLHWNSELVKMAFIYWRKMATISQASTKTCPRPGSSQDKYIGLVRIILVGLHVETA